MVINDEEPRLFCKIYSSTVYAYPLEEIVDPSSAGDSFIGITNEDDTSIRTVKVVI